MATKCKVCIHPDLATIDKLLLQGQSTRLIATQYNLTQSSVTRHFSNHLREQWHKAQQGKGDRMHKIVESVEDRILQHIEAYDTRWQGMKSKETPTALEADKAFRLDTQALKPWQDLRLKMAEGSQTATLRAFLPKLEELIEEQLDSESQHKMKNAIMEALAHAKQQTN